MRRGRLLAAAEVVMVRKSRRWRTIFCKSITIGELFIRIVMRRGRRVLVWRGQMPPNSATISKPVISTSRRSTTRTIAPFCPLCSKSAWGRLGARVIVSGPI